MKYSVYLPLALLLLSGCVHCSKDEKIANGWTLSYAKELKKKDNLFLNMIGGGGDGHGKIKRLSVGFEGERQFDIDEARRFFIEKAQRFINKINASPDVDWVMSNHPIGIENIKIVFSFYDKKFKPLSAQYVCHVANYGNRICYSVWNPDKKGIMGQQGMGVMIYRETYEAALKALETGTPYSDYLADIR